MADNPVVINGTVYPDEAAATVATHPDIPEDIKRLYVSPNKPEDTSGQGEPVKPTYDTPLTPEQESAYQGKFDVGASRDYDMRGWFLQNQDQEPNAEGVHYPDTFKKPNHITFSDQSQYSNKDMQGGTWGQNQDGSYTFTPSAFNLQQHSPQELKDYFAQYEKGNILNLNTAQGMASEASEKAADALKRAQSTLPTFDSDTGLYGPVIQSIKGMREQGLDPNITSDQIDNAINIGLSFSGGGLTFKGVRSPTFDRGLLYKAQNMQANGASPAEIWADTGTFQGADGRWRQEIPDNKASIKPSAIERVSPNLDETPKSWYALNYQFREPLKLTDVLDHPELFAAYPHLADVDVRPTPPFSFGTSGSYNAENNLLRVGPQNKEEMLKTILHEVQHAIQNREGFSMGGNSQQFLPPGFTLGENLFNKALDKTTKAMEDAGMTSQEVREAIYARQLEAEGRTHIGTINPEPRGTYLDAKPSLAKAKRLGFSDQVDTMVEGKRYIDKMSDKAFKDYLKVMGEVEARNVEIRSQMDDLKLKLESPMSTEPVPRDQQIESKLQAKGTSAKEDVVPFRRAANDNEPGLYNPREPDMIGSMETDDFIDKAWSDLRKRNDDAKSVLDQIDAIHARAREQGRELSEIEHARIDKLSDEWGKLTK